MVQWDIQTQEQERKMNMKLIITITFESDDLEDLETAKAEFESEFVPQDFQDKRISATVEIVP